MNGFLNELKVQRWDDHRYYHHSRINQSLHFLSALSFLCAYVVVFSDPATAALIAWLVAMTSRQIGHMVFEPRGYDHVNQATDDYKEEIKVGYNIKRKIVLLAVWAASPLLLVIDPTLLGIFEPHADMAELVAHVGQLWLVVGLAGIAFRAVQLFILKDVRTGLVWVTKIATDPFHDIKLYHRAPFAFLAGGATAAAVAHPNPEALCEDDEEEIAEEIPVAASKPGV
jgi:hypothetical protein